MHIPGGESSPVVAKAKLGLEPRFRNRFGALIPDRNLRSNAVKGLEPDDRNRFGELDCAQSVGCSISG